MAAWSRQNGLTRAGGDLRRVGWVLLAAWVLTALTVGGLAWRFLRAEARERERASEQRERSAQARFAERAEARVSEVARGLSEVAREARLGGDGPGVIELFVASQPLVVSGFALDGAGRLIVPPDRRPRPRGPEPTAEELSAWRELNGPIDSLLSSSSAADAALAVMLIEAGLEAVTHVDLAGSFELRRARALARAGDVERAVRALRQLILDPARRSAREPSGGAIGPAAALDLAELHAREGRTEAAIGALHELTALMATGALYLGDEEVARIEGVVADALARLAPDRAAAIVEAARAEAARTLAVQAEVVPRLNASWTAGSRRLGRVEGSEPVLHLVEREEDGWTFGVTVDLARLRQVLGDERADLADAPLSVMQRPAFVLLALSLIGLAIAAALFLAWRALARATELARLRQEFVENVTHELRTPLTSIRSLAEVLQRGGDRLDPERVTTYHRTIEREAVRLAGIVENVLRAARLERGSGSLALEDVSPREIVEEAIDTFSRLPEGRGRTPPTLEGSGPDRVCVDRAAAVQALLNLLSNAAKYSPDGAPIEVTWRPRNA
ncbi:MAG: sensor histidine kinase, partial [Planctomycetota bacterium]